MTGVRGLDRGARLQTVAPRLAGTPWIAQGWRDVVFAHWYVDASAVAPLLPRGVRPDTLDGRTTWVGLIAFRFVDTSFPVLGAIGSARTVGPVGTFVEVNVRVYTIDDAERHGVVFLSLDASKLAPVLAARTITALPYHWAEAEFRRRSGDRVGYAMRRHRSRLRSQIDVRIGDRIDDPSDLDVFLSARWGMHVRRFGATRFWPNEHESWPLYRATVDALHDDLIGAAGLPMSLTDVPPDSVLYSPGVTTRFGPPA